MTLSGTGKTRTASSLTDVLSRGGYVTNVLFLADRTALVKQAKEDFKKYLPDISLCNLCENRDDRSARIVFSTYPTMLNAIDDCKNENGQKLFTPAHFDLVIIDESHRSIFKKYRAIFEYFDAMLLGLTATPRTDVDRNTYDFFEMENGVPTYAYDYETAVRQDHVLVPYYNYEVKTKFLHEGIRYDELSEEDKVRYEEDFAEDDTIPEFIPSSKLNKFIFNETTVDMVIQDLMERGIKVGGGDRLGKTIIFAQNKRHADFIVKRIDKLYPQYNGKLAQRVLCDDAYAQTVIDDFKVKEYPRIVVSVDMMDTGIDVTECLNLVFFKQVMSKTKFWQMIGRGTRLCPDLSCVDQVEGEYDGKKRFLIFDYCGNFAFFREKPNGYETKDVQSLTESIFIRKIRIVEALQDKAFSEDRYQQWRNLLVDESHGQVTALNTELVSVRLKLQYVEKYRKKEAFQFIGDTEKGELTAHIAPLVYMNEPDDYAKAFDNFMYGLILAALEGKPSFKRAKSQLCLTAELLEKKSNIPQVGTRLPMIKKIGTDAYWDAGDILLFEETRRELRGLIRFLADMGEKKKPIITRLTDPVIDMQEGSALDPAYDFEDYRKKVNRYVEEHGDTMAIYKLKRNIPLSTGDYQELERVFTEELGSKEDYAREYGETPFGLLIRRIVKLDHDAAMEAFSQFINDESLNQRQIVYVRKIINHIEQNGYMDNVNDLMKPPFDKPVSFVKLFDAKKRSQIIEAINGVRENAVNVVA